MCNNGFEMVGNLCLPKRPDTNCSDNSYYNGLGECVCKAGFVRRNGRCVPDNNCPPYSTPDVSGNCQCDLGYRKYDGVYCSLCPSGQVSVGGTCIKTCGVNEVVNPQTSKCECISGYGLYEGICNSCPRDFFLLNGYCVTCPLFSQYNSQDRRCVCKSGMTLVGGICKDQCTQPNEVFNVQTNKCMCFSGLGRVGGVCQICSNGLVDPIS